MKHARILVCLCLLCILVLCIISCGSSGPQAESPPTTAESAPQTPTPPPPPSKWNDPTNANVISANDTAGYYGQSKIVQGLIVTTHNSGKACFLDFKYDYQNGFVGVIFASAFAAFPASPQSYYANKEVRISGTVTQYQGHPQIIIESPNQIEISKDSAASYSPAPSPTQNYAGDQTDEQTLEDSGLHIDENGDYVDEEGNVVDIEDYRQE